MSDPLNPLSGAPSWWLRLSSSTARVRAAIAVAVLALVTVLVVLTPSSERSTRAATDVYSKSAVGHHALVAFLKEQGVPVAVTRRPFGGVSADAGQAATVLEPSPGVELEDTTEQGWRRCILALPKWSIEPSPDDPQRVGAARLLPVADVEALLGGPAVVRGGGQVTCDRGVLLHVPQLIEDSAITPVLRCGDGVVAGFIYDVPGMPCERTLVIADPDLFNNHGIGRGDNATALRDLIVDSVEATSLLIAESVHNHRPPVSLLDELREFPLSLVPIHFAILAGFVIWSGLRRFGPALTPPPRFPPGGETLALHAATLLTRAGTPQWTVEQTWHRTLQRLTRGVDQHQRNAADVPMVDQVARLARARQAGKPGLEAEALELAALVHRACASEKTAHRGVGGTPSRAAMLEILRRIHSMERRLTS